MTRRLDEVLEVLDELRRHLQDDDNAAHDLLDELTAERRYSIEEVEAAFDLAHTDSTIRDNGGQTTVNGVKAVVMRMLPLEELVERQGLHEQLRQMCTSIEEEAESNPLARIGSFRGGMHTAVRAIRTILDPPEDP
jgi:hypothetical protein